MNPSHPPQLNGLQLTHSVVMRFVTNAAVAQTGITWTNLLETFIFASSATVPYRVFQAVRIRRIRLWAVPALGAATTVQAEFSGTVLGVQGDQQIHADTSMGIQPAFLSARPSPRSLASDYQVASANNAFLLTCPSGTVVDVELSYRGQFAAGDVCANAGVAMTVGATYLRGLDGLPTATTVFVPAVSANFVA